MLSTYFTTCLDAPYHSVGRHGDYYTERRGATLFIYFECSHGRADWMHNLNFLPTGRTMPLRSLLPALLHCLTGSAGKPTCPYRHMTKNWKCHQGFLQVFRSIEPYLAPLILDPTVKKIVTVGYSHGAALAVLCHEYVWFHRPDLRPVIEGYGFGCPRVFWGLPRKSVKARWARFTVIRNRHDLVTHLPPRLFGFSHVGNLLRIGHKRPWSPIDAHRPENILAALRDADL